MFTFFHLDVHFPQVVNIAGFAKQSSFGYIVVIQARVVGATVENRVNDREGRQGKLLLNVRGLRDFE